MKFFEREKLNAKIINELHECEICDCKDEILNETSNYDLVKNLTTIVIDLCDNLVREGKGDMTREDLWNYIQEIIDFDESTVGEISKEYGNLE